MQSPFYNPAEKTDPNQVIRDFCQSYHHYEAQGLLWEWFETAISRGHSMYDDANERSTLVLLYQHMNRLIAAAYALHQRASDQSTNTKSNPPK